MRALARYILSGPIQAVVVVYGFAVLSLPFPFLIIFSGAALVLVTLQLGFSQSIKVMLISAALFAASTYFLLGVISLGPILRLVADNDGCNGLSKYAIDKCIVAIF